MTNTRDPIKEIKERSPIELGFAAERDLRRLSDSELNELEAVIASYDDPTEGVMGSSLYGVNKRGELVYKRWPSDYPLERLTIRPVIDNVGILAVGPALLGGLFAFSGNLRDALYASAFGAVAGAITFAVYYFKSATVQKRYETYLSSQVRQRSSLLDERPTSLEEGLGKAAEYCFRAAADPEAKLEDELGKIARYLQGE